MLNDKEFEELCLRLGFTRESREYAERMLKRDPQRLVRSSRGNVSGRYPSRRTGYTVQFESHTCELPFLLDLEYFQPDALIWVDQPDFFKLQVKDKKGRSIYVVHTPDFFVCHKTHFEFIECKTEEELIKLSHKYPDRYVLGKDGVWRCPKAEAYAAQFGYKFRVVSSAEIDRVQIRNAVFFEDYLGEDTPEVAEETRRKLASLVAENHRLKLSDLLDRDLEDGATADDVYTMIATGELYVDLRLEPLVERDRVWVYPDKEAAKGYVMENALGDFPRAKYIEAREGARILWNNRVMRIVHVGETKIFFEGEDGAAPALTYSHFEELIKRGEIQGVRSDPDSDPDQQWKALLNKANQKRKAEALRRERILKCHLAGEPLPEKVSKRTLARWKARYLLAERLYGNGLVGLLPGWHLRGDRKTQKLNPVARSIMMDLIENDYETIVSKGMFVVWGKVIVKCRERKPSVQSPSYVTFIRYVKKRPEHLQALKRKGHRAAYASQPFYYYLDKDTPRHGDRPMEICHIDHTELDVELVDSRTGENLGRPWVTFMVCAFSRRVVAVHVTYDPPSIKSDMMIIRECVRRTGRLPQIVVVDGGSDFKSVYFETLMAAFSITVKRRPGAEPRFGSPIERLFYTTKDQFVRTKLGNTQITRNVRQITKTNNPKKLAVWDIGTLYEALCEWAYECYDTERHSTLKQSPRDAYFSALRLTGERRHRWIAYDDEFKILTLPPTKKGTAINQVGEGVKIFGRYYWCDELGLEEFEGKRLEGRYDPFDISIAYVYLKDRWVKCLCERHLNLKGRTEREQRLISEEERRREQMHTRDLSTRGVARAIKALKDEKKEKEQAERRRILHKQQRENRSVLNAINGGVASQPKTDRHSGEGTAAQAVAHTTQETKAVSLFSKVDTSKLGSLGEYKG